MGTSELVREGVILRLAVAALLRAGPPGDSLPAIVERLEQRNR